MIGLLALCLLGQVPQSVGGCNPGKECRALDIRSPKVFADFADAGTLNVRGGTVLGSAQDGGFITQDNPVLHVVRNGDTLGILFGPKPAAITTYDWSLGYYGGGNAIIERSRVGEKYFYGTSLIPFIASSGNLGSTTSHWNTLYVDTLNVGSGNIALTPASAIYTTDGGANDMPSGTTRIDYWGKVKDSTNSVTNTPGAWLWTAPYAGTYSVCAEIEFDYTSGSGGTTCPTPMASHRIILYLTVNGSTSIRFVDTNPQAACNTQTYGRCINWKFAAADTAYVNFTQTTGVTRNLNPNALTNNISFTWIGP